MPSNESGTLGETLANEPPPQYSQFAAPSPPLSTDSESPPASDRCEENHPDSINRVISQLDLCILASEKVHRRSPAGAGAGPYESCCVLDDRFVLTGHMSRGVEVTDMLQRTRSTTILWTRVRQMAVIKSARLILMIAGRNKRVRCYSLDAILRLCYAMFHMDWNSRSEPEYDVPSLDDWRRVVLSQSGRGNGEAEAGMSGAGHHRRPGHSSGTKTTTNENLVLAGTMLGQKQHYVCNRVVLQDFCYKLPDTKDSLRVLVYETSSFIFVSVMQKDKLSLWQLKRGNNSHPRLLNQPLTRFNEYWIPQEPRWVSFADDRATLRFLLAVFPAEATAIGIKNSKVHAVPVDKLTEPYQSTSRRLKFESNATAAAAAAATAATQNTNTRSSSRRLRAFSIPPQQQQRREQRQSLLMIPQSASFPELPTTTNPAAMEWTSLIQLPFYPTIQASTLTEDYSIPPTYDTVVTNSPHMAADPVALTSTASPQLFFATLGRQSYIIDLSGRLFTTQVYIWTHEPQHIEFIELDDWCVIGFSRECVELLRLKTAEHVHRLMNGVAINYLGRWESDGKSKAARAVCWSCTTPQDVTQIYMLRRRSPSA